MINKLENGKWKKFLIFQFIMDYVVVVFFIFEKYLCKY